MASEMRKELPDNTKIHQVEVFYKSDNSLIEELNLTLDEKITIEKAHMIYSKISLCNKLKVLKLNILETCPIDLEGFVYFIQIMFKLTGLISFSFSMNNKKITNIQFVQFCYALSHMKQLKKLELDFDKNPIFAGGASAIKITLSYFKELVELRLSFSNCMFDKEGSNELGEGISQCVLLKKLYVNISAEYTIEKSYSEGLIPIFKKCEHLQDVELDVQQLADSEGMVLLAEEISQSKYLNKLILNFKQRYSRMSKIEANQVGKHLAKISSLVYLTIVISESYWNDEEDSYSEIKKYLSKGKRITHLLVKKGN